MTENAFNAAIALLFVLALLFALLWLVRRFGAMPGSISFKGAKKTPAVLDIITTKTLDPRHRILVVAWRDMEYLLSIGPNGVVKIDQKIPTPDAETAPAHNFAHPIDPRE